VAELQRIHNLGTSTRIYAGQTLCVLMGQRGDGPNEGFTPYAVKGGDTLARIARRFGVEMTVLAKVNKLADANKIYAGQVLCIPAVTIQ
jgi:LysM repeat protein